MSVLVSYLCLLSQRIPQAIRAFTFVHLTVDFLPESYMSRSRLQEEFLYYSKNFRYWLRSYKKSILLQVDFEYFDNLIYHALSVIRIYSALCRVDGRPVHPVLKALNLKIPAFSSEAKKLKGVS